MSIIEKPPLVGDGLSELCQAGSFDNPEVKRSHQKPHIKYQGPAEAAFDTEIALVLAASHWRTAALFLHLTAKYAEAGDYLSLDRIAVERANNSSAPRSTGRRRGMDRGRCVSRYRAN